MNLKQYIAVVFIIILMPITAPLMADEAPIYRVTDDQGNVTFTDQKPAKNTKANTQKLTLPKVNTQPAVVIPPPVTAQADAETPNTEIPETDTENVPYTSFRITSPTPKETIPTGHRVIVAQLEVAPLLQAGDLIKYYHGGKSLGEPSTSTSISLSDLIRGEHQLRAEIIGEDGKMKAKTKTVTFYVQRQVSNKAPRRTPKS